MFINVSPLMGMIGTLSILVMLVVLALLSKRLGSVTRAAPYYVGFYIAAALVGISLLLQILCVRGDVKGLTPTNQELLMLVIFAVLPALALTIAVVVAWRYWSWLLAERG